MYLAWLAGTDMGHTGNILENEFMLMKQIGSTEHNEKGFI